MKKRFLGGKLECRLISFRKNFNLPIHFQSDGDFQFYFYGFDLFIKVR